MQGAPGLESLRRAFPALDGGLVFLDWGTTGLLPRSARDAVVSFLEGAASCPGAESGWMHLPFARLRDRVRCQVADLLGARREEIALVESTTAGLNAAADSIPLQQGDQVLLSALDYAAVATPWKARARREALELSFVPARRGAIEASDFIERMGKRTRVVALSTLAWTTGGLTDVAALGEACRRRGIFFLVDGVQSFGVVPLDVKAARIDFLAVGGHKWLNAPLGLGFLFVDHGVRERLLPLREGFLNGRAPRGSFLDWFQDPKASPSEEILPPATARAFETGGTPCFPGVAGLHESLALLAGVGLPAIHAHVCHLARRLVAGLKRLGLFIATPQASQGRGGVVVFNLPEGPPAERALVAALARRRIVVAERYCGGVGGVRVCLHGMNVPEDVERLLTALRER